jgi:hypothetical protein
MVCAIFMMLQYKIENNRVENPVTSGLEALLSLTCTHVFTVLCTNANEDECLGAVTEVAAKCFNGTCVMMPRTEVACGLQCLHLGSSTTDLAAGHPH